MPKKPRRLRRAVSSRIIPILTVGRVTDEDAFYSSVYHNTLLPKKKIKIAEVPNGANFQSKVLNAKLLEGVLLQ